MKTFKILLIVMLLPLLIPAVNARPKRGNNLYQVVNSYLEIKSAMTSGDGIMAKVKSNKMFHILASHPDKGLSHPQRLIMSRYLGDMIDACSEMSETTEISEQTLPYRKLTANLRALVKGLKLKVKRF